MSNRKKVEDQRAARKEAQREQDAERTEEQTSDSASYLTNRGNLVEILSSGLIKPPKAYSKYYKDANAHCPSAVVLFWGDPAVDTSTNENQGNAEMFPVLLDVDAEGLSINAHIRKDYSVGNSKETDDMASILTGVVPANRISAVHFRTDEELAEFQGREYANLRVPNGLYRVSPERFKGLPTYSKKLVAVLEKFGAEANTSLLTRIKAAEARSGALLLWAFLEERYAKPRRTEAEETPALNSKWGIRLFDLCFEAATARTPQSFFHSDLLEEVRDRLQSEIFDAGSEGESGEEYLKWMETMSGILDNVVEIDAFPPDAPKPLNALLYFLLHSEPETLMGTWREQGDTVPAWLEAAAAWCGALNKHARIPVHLRPSVQTEIGVGEWEAAYMNGTLSEPLRSMNGFEFELKEVLEKITKEVEAEESITRASTLTGLADKKKNSADKKTKSQRRESAIKGRDVIPATAFTSMIYGNLKGVPIKPDTTRYGGPGLDTDAGNENLAKVTIPFNCVFRHLYVRTASPQPISGALILTIRKNGSNTALVLNITPGANAGLYSQTKNKTQFVAGDEFSIRLENNAKSASATICGWSIEYEVE